MMELLAGIVVAVAALALVLEPLVRGRAWSPAYGSSDGEIDFTDIEESDSPKIRALLALKEIEFDRETGKLSDEDYVAMKADYQRTALAAIEAEEQGLDGGRSVAVASVCPSCGPRPESQAKYCSDCGRTLIAGGESQTCKECGEPVPPGARFCGECGAALGAS